MCAPHSHSNSLRVCAVCARLCMCVSCVHRVFFISRPVCELCEFCSHRIENWIGCANCVHGAICTHTHTQTHMWILCAGRKRRDKWSYFCHLLHWWKSFKWKKRHCLPSCASVSYVSGAGSSRASESANHISWPNGFCPISIKRCIKTNEIRSYSLLRGDTQPIAQKKWRKSKCNGQTHWWLLLLLWNLSQIKKMITTQMHIGASGFVWIRDETKRKQTNKLPFRLAKQQWKF